MLADAGSLEMLTSKPLKQVAVAMVGAGSVTTDGLTLSDCALTACTPTPQDAVCSVLVSASVRADRGNEARTKYSENALSSRQCS